MSTFSGSQFKGAMRAYRELRREDAAIRQAAFDAAWEAEKAKHGETPFDRKAFGQLRRARRLLFPTTEETAA